MLVVPVDLSTLTYVCSDDQMTGQNSESEVALPSSAYSEQNSLTVTATQSGYYQCVGNNSLGAARSEPDALRFFVTGEC